MVRSINKTGSAVLLVIRGSVRGRERWSLRLMLVEVAGSFGAISDGEFLKNMLQMKLDGALTEMQRFGDVRVAQALRNQSEHLPFARRERFDEISFFTPPQHPAARRAGEDHVSIIDLTNSGDSLLRRLRFHGKASRPLFHR